MGTGNMDEYTPYIQPDLGDITALFIDNDAAFEEQAKAHRAEAEEELAPDTGLSGCVALEPEEIQNAVAQGLQDGLTNAELLAAMAEIGTAARDLAEITQETERAFAIGMGAIQSEAETGEPFTDTGRTYGDPELQAYEDWLDRMEPFMKHGADCVATGYETINLGSSLLTQPIDYRNTNPAEDWSTLTFDNIQYKFRMPKRGRCGSRKRFVKLMMSLGIERNEAKLLADIAASEDKSYGRTWREYYTLAEMFQFQPSGLRGHAYYDNERDKWRVSPAICFTV